MTVGVLLINLGTPDAPTPKAVRNYLKEFLSDPAVVKIPRLIWIFILYGFILPFRSRKSAKLYQKIWMPSGSPLRIYSGELAEKLQNYLGEKYKVILAMRYGKPDIHTAIINFKILNIKNIMVLPLYPQYSETTTGSVITAVNKLLDPKLAGNTKIIAEYYNNLNYIQAIGNSLKNINAQKILFSFHGLPQKFIEDGDVYLTHCQNTVKNIVEYLKLDKTNYKLAFQSNIGKAKWLQPYTETVLKQWAEEGIKSVAVICPGFAVDCLETLEEINMRAREVFLNAGGKEFYYIPALNSSDAQVKLLADVILHD